MADQARLASASSPPPAQAAKRSRRSHVHPSSFVMYGLEETIQTSRLPFGPRGQRVSPMGSRFQKRICPKRPKFRIPQPASKRVISLTMALIAWSRRRSVSLRQPPDGRGAHGLLGGGGVAVTLARAHFHHLVRAVHNHPSATPEPGRLRGTVLPPGMVARRTQDRGDKGGLGSGKARRGGVASVNPGLPIGSSLARRPACLSLRA